MQFAYTAPVTNKLLIEAAFSQFFSNWGGQTPAGALDAPPFIPVVQQIVGSATGIPVANMPYHGFAGLANNHQTHNVWRASALVRDRRPQHEGGLRGGIPGVRQFGNYAEHGLQYQFGFDAATGQVVPNQITQRITPWQQANRTRYDAFYVQDQWTHNRLTLQGALRYEHAWSFFPEGLNGLLADSVFGGPAFTLPEAKGVTGYNDIAPRMGLAYDVFGDGKTAIKVNLSKYFQATANDGVYINANKASTFAQTANRAWTDGNGNFTPDCDLQNPALQDNIAAGGDLCGVPNNANFFAFSQTHSLGTATRREPGVAERLERASLRLAVQRVGAAGADAARVGGNRLQPPRRGATSPTPTTARSAPQDFDTYTMTVPTDSAAVRTAASRSRMRC